MTVINVPGRKNKHVMLYALSTCGWCQKTRELLEELGVEYNYCYVDQLQGEDQDKALMDMYPFNPQGNFPTVVIDKEKALVGYKEQELRELLE